MQKTSKLILGMTLASVVLLGAGVSLIIDIFTNVPDFTQLREKVVVPIKLANEDKSEKEMGPKSRGWVPMKSISNHMVMAVIASEDTSFFSHDGVDYHELKESIKKDWETKSWARGGSTITQQVVKNVYLGRQKTLWRKLKEFFWAQKLSKALSKSEILCFYLNMAEWAPGLYGIGAASEHYFGIPPSSLSAKQAAFLAMLIPSPIKYHVYFEKKMLTDWAKKRIEQILRVMNRMEFIDDSTYSVALAEPLWGVPSTASNPVLGKDEQLGGIPSEETEDIFKTPYTKPERPAAVPRAQQPSNDQVPLPDEQPIPEPPKEQPMTDTPKSPEVEPLVPPSEESKVNPEVPKGLELDQ